MNQIALKVLPALAAGCPAILKPSEHTPVSAAIYTEILHEARLHPDWRLCDLNGWESRRLAKATLDLPQRSYETGGITNDLARAARLKAEGVKRRAYRWQAFARAGQPCYRCGAEIERCEDAGRRLYICYGCQE